MQFLTEDYKFEIDGIGYTLPEMNIDLFEKIAALYEIDNPVEQMTAWRDAILDEAETDEAKAAIRKLGVRKVAALFKDWTGIGSKAEKDAGLKPGEASSSTD